MVNRKALDYYGNVLTEKDRAILMEYPLRRIMQLSMEESTQLECTNDNIDESFSSSDDEPPAKRVTKAAKRVLDDDEKEAIRLQRQAQREKCYAVARRHLEEGDFDGYFNKDEIVVVGITKCLHMTFQLYLGD